MSEFKVVYEPPTVPVGMKVVGLGVIVSCLALCALFGWGIYLNLAGESVAAVTKTQEAAKDNLVEDGLLIRKKPPAFTLKIPASMEPRPLQGSQIFSVAQEREPFSVRITVDDLGGVRFDDWVKGASVRWAAALKAMGGYDARMVRLETTDLYASFKGVQAKELVIEWTWQDGSTRLTNLNHFILKGGKIITLSGTVLSDADLLRRIYKTIDLEP
jgi:hypothetical protein